MSIRNLTFYLLAIFRAVFRVKRVVYDTKWLWENTSPRSMLRDLFPHLCGDFQAPDGAHIFNRADFRRIRRCRRGIRARL